MVSTAICVSGSARVYWKYRILLYNYWLVCRRRRCWIHLSIICLGKSEQRNQPCTVQYRTPLYYSVCSIHRSVNSHLCYSSTTSHMLLSFRFFSMRFHFESVWIGKILSLLHPSYVHHGEMESKFAFATSFIDVASNSFIDVVSKNMVEDLTRIFFATRYFRCRFSCQSLWCHLRNPQIVFTVFKNMAKPGQTRLNKRKWSEP